MAQVTMYPGINNSPQTTLSAAITASDTTIEVMSVAGFPEAPNIITIGQDDDAELVRYGGISGLQLTGCERGFNETTAKIWPRDELVYRGFTEYDYDALRHNISDLDESKLAKTGDGSDVTAEFSAASTKANIATGEKLSVIFGKLTKWFSSFGAAAWLNVGTTAGTVAAGLHAAQHKSNGADAIAPADIGAAAAAHKSNHATGGSDVLTPGDIGALTPTGNGSSVTVAASAASSRANLSTGDALSVIVGKLMKWFSDFGAAAWLGVGTAAGTVAAGNHSHYLIFTNTAVAVSAWAASTTYASQGYVFQADITLSGALASMLPAVTFAPAEADGGNFARVATPLAGAVRIYAKAVPAAAITIPTIQLFKA